MQYANKINSTEPVSLAGHTYAEHDRKRSFFSNTFSKITPIIWCSYRLLQTQDRKKSHCSMYTKSKDFSTVCKEIKQTDLKTNLFKHSVHHKIRMESAERCGIDYLNCNSVNRDICSGLS